jgi:hypothetical protein
VDETLDSVAEARIDVMSRDELLEVIERADRGKAVLEARSQQALARLHELDNSGKDYVAEEVAVVLRLAPTTAMARLHQAAEHVARLPRMMELLELGQTSPLHLKVLAEATRDLAPELVAQVEARLLERAEYLTVGEFRSAARRFAARLDPRITEKQHVDRVTQRRVEHFADEHGMATVWAYLPAPGAAKLMAAVDAHAHALVDEPGAERTLDQKRADVLTDLADLALGHPDLASANRPAVQVTVALSTLLGCDDAPGELAGYGPIPAALAREIAADPNGTWQRLVTDTAGRVLDASRSYSPPPRLRDHVIARDPTCRFPGCRRNACRCELDHLIPYPRGSTAVENLHPLCPRHHHLKHEAGWRVQRSGDGTTTWTTPTGRRVDKPPDDPLAA